MTFDPFGDFETRGYLRNVAGEKDPERVKRLEHDAFRSRVGEALAALRTGKPLGYQDVLDTHKRLFGDMYPWAGQDRAVTAPQLAVGKAGRYDLFAHPQDARRAAEHALDMAADPSKMRAKPGEVMGLLAYGHPVLDGNGRTLMTVHAELCRRAGIRIAWKDVAKADYLAVLTRELERPGKALDTFLAPHIQRPAASVAQDAERLRTLPGLGPLASDPNPSKAEPLGARPALDARSVSKLPEPQPGEAPRRGLTGLLQNVQRPSDLARKLPWEPEPVRMADRVRAFEDQAAKTKEAAAKPPEPAAEPDADAPKPRPGPRP